MKRALSLLTMAAIISATVMTSCNKDAAVGRTPQTSHFTGNTSAKSTSADLPDYSNWGYYHNQALDVSEDYWGKPGHDMKTAMGLMRQRMAATYPAFKNIDDADFNAAVNTPELDAVIAHKGDDAAQATAFNRSVLDAKLANGVISQTMHNGLSNAFDAGLPFEQIKSRLDAIPTASLSADEQHMLSATRSILVSSHDYWTKYGTTHPNVAARLSNSQQTIIVDALYGAGFFSLGPLGLLVAAGFSCAYSD